MTGNSEAELGTLEAMGSARAMRYFRPDPVPAELVDRVLWAGTRASSPNNCQPWDFVVVRDPQVRDRIGELFAPIVAAAGDVTASLPPDLDASQRRTAAGAMHLMSNMAQVPVIVFICGVNNYPQPDQPDISYMYSALYAAGQNMLVAARALGLGAAFTTLHKMVEPGLRELLKLPEDRILGVTLPLGWPAGRFGPLKRRPVEEVVHHDVW